MKVKPIKLTATEKKDYPKSALMAIELTNMLTDQKLCGVELTFKNGWTVKCKNKKLAKELGVPMK